MWKLPDDFRRQIMPEKRTKYLQACPYDLGNSFLKTRLANYKCVCKRYQEIMLGEAENFVVVTLHSNLAVVFPRMFHERVRVLALI